MGLQLLHLACRLGIMTASWAIPHPVHCCKDVSAARRRVLIQDTNKRTVQDIKGRLATVTDLPGNGWVMAQLDGGEAPFRIQQRHAGFPTHSGCYTAHISRTHGRFTAAVSRVRGLHKVLNSWKLWHMHVSFALAVWTAQSCRLLPTAGICATRRLLRGHRRCRRSHRRPGRPLLATPRCRRGR